MATTPTPDVQLNFDSMTVKTSKALLQKFRSVTHLQKMFGAKPSKCEIIETLKARRLVGRDDEVTETLRLFANFVYSWYFVDPNQNIQIGTQIPLKMTVRAYKRLVMAGNLSLCAGPDYVRGVETKKNKLTLHLVFRFKGVRITCVYPKAPLHTLRKALSLIASKTSRTDVRRRMAYLKAVEKQMVEKLKVIAHKEAREVLMWWHSHTRFDVAWVREVAFYRELVWDHPEQHSLVYKLHLAIARRGRRGFMAPVTRALQLLTYKGRLGDVRYFMTSMWKDTLPAECCPYLRVNYFNRTLVKYYGLIQTEANRSRWVSYATKIARVVVAACGGMDIRDAFSRWRGRMIGPTRKEVLLSYLREEVYSGLIGIWGAFKEAAIALGDHVADGGSPWWYFYLYTRARVLNRRDYEGIEPTVGEVVEAALRFFQRRGYDIPLSFIQGFGVSVMDLDEIEEGTRSENSDASDSPERAWPVLIESQATRYERTARNDGSDEEDSDYNPVSG